MYSTHPAIFYTLLAGLGTLTFLLLFFVVSVLRLHRQRIQEMRNLSLRETVVMEEERTRMATDLHDDFGSHISAMIMTVRSIAETYPENNYTDRLISELNDSLVRLKQISHNLMPRVIEKEGLCVAVEELMNEIVSAGKIAVKFESDCDESGFVAEKCLVIYRVVQEILSNTIRHAGAELISGSIKTFESKLILDLRDNGKGFTPQEIRKPVRSFGLQNIHARLQLLDASYVLRSPPGAGTHYHIEIPVISLQTPINDTLANAHEKYRSHLHHHS